MKSLWRFSTLSRIAMSDLPSVSKRQLSAEAATSEAVKPQKAKKPKGPKPRPKPPKTDILTAEELNDADIYIENGLRKVRPYYFTFRVFVKQRWFGKKLIDVMSSEFRTDIFYNHLNSIETGRLTVNMEKVSPDTILQNGDVIHHRVHRHELPVLADPIGIIANTDDLVVINKPCSIPAHPCGRYRHNSVTFMMGRDHGMTNLRILYRLDRLTSGLMIFSKSHEKALSLARLMVDRAFKKTYVCRVVGRVPWEEAECHEPIDVYSRFHAVYQASNESSAKASSTKFERVYADDKSSVVKCYPLTGRTHQIRVHLQYLGHPILNDPLYHNYAWGPKLGKGGDYDGLSKEKILSNLGETFSLKKWINDDDDDGEPKLPVVVPLETEPPSVDTDSPYYDKNCGYCQFKFNDPTRSELALFLHALRYEGPDFAYETPMPDWASADYCYSEDDDVTVREEKLKNQSAK